MPRLPKRPELLQRRNRVTSRALLAPDANANASVPPLPRLRGRQRWHPRVRDWWVAVWRSPMASEYLEADRDGLTILAQLYQAFWTTEELKVRVQIASEIRQQSARFGLSPVDRRRLQWEIEKADSAAERGKR